MRPARCGLGMVEVEMKERIGMVEVAYDVGDEVERKRELPTQRMLK
jgi:hypothetical protein